MLAQAFGNVFEFSLSGRPQFDLCFVQCVVFPALQSLLGNLADLLWGRFLIIRPANVFCFAPCIAPTAQKIIKGNIAADIQVSDEACGATPDAVDLFGA